MNALQPRVTFGKGSVQREWALVTTINSINILVQRWRISAPREDVWFLSLVTGRTTKHRENLPLNKVEGASLRTERPLLYCTVWACDHACLVTSLWIVSALSDDLILVLPCILPFKASMSGKKECLFLNCNALQTFMVVQSGSLVCEENGRGYFSLAFKLRKRGRNFSLGDLVRLTFLVFL